MEWKVKEFMELTVTELYELLALRGEIFVVEQECIYNDLDNLDQQGIHVFGNHEGRIVAYARLLPGGTRFDNASIGRVVVDKSMRGLKVGQELMHKSIEQLKKRWDVSVIQISAQKHLEKFYSDLGFNTISDVYLEDGIPHIKMQYGK